MSADPFDSPTVCEVLDIFYADLDHEPDWAAIRTRLFTTRESLYGVCEDLLRAVWFVYERDFEVQKSKVFALQNGLL